MRYGDRVGKWQIVESLGKGGAGEVFRVCRPAVPSQTRALKVLNFGSSANREINTLTDVSHRHVVRFIEVLKSSGGLPVGSIGIVMEEADYSLAGLIDSRGPVSPPEFRQLAFHILSGLTHLHSVETAQGKGLAHGDLKPANVLRVGDVWKLADFGIATPLDESGVASARGLTPMFAPPEILEGSRAASAPTISAAADIYSFGALAYFCMTGQAPPRRPYTHEVLDNRIEAALAQQAAELVLACLEFDPSYRPTVDEVVHLVDELGPRPRSGKPSDQLRDIGMHVREARSSLGSERFLASLLELVNRKSAEQFIGQAFWELAEEGDWDFFESVLGACEFALLMDEGLAGTLFPLVTEELVEEARELRRNSHPLWQ